VWQDEDCIKSVPDVSFVDAALRRRLGFLAKMFLKVANDCTHDILGARLVYASRHGDLTRTTSMLIDLADEQMLSPTAFSMSVPNAAAGIYSILKHDTSPSSVVSAAESSFGFGLLEASLQLAANPDAPVLFIYADEPAPAIYGVVSGDLAVPHAIGILLTNGATSEIDCKMECSAIAASAISQSHSFLQCLGGGSPAVWHGEGRAWNWSWHDCKN
jgi:hypothetical protein